MTQSCCHVYSWSIYIPHIEINGQKNMENNLRYENCQHARKFDFFYIQIVRNKTDIMQNNQALYAMKITTC